MDYKTEIAKLIEIDGITTAEISDMLIPPKDSKLGDWCLPCFRFAKTMHLSPMAIADILSQKIVKPDYISEISSVSGYLNFKLNSALYAKNIVEKVLKDGDNYGKSNIGEGKTICIDYSSVNIAKPFHIGHLMTTVIGAALYRLFKFLGYKCVGINHLGDWGTQFGKLIVAYKKWGSEDELLKGGVKKLNEWYVKYHVEAEKDKELDNEARAWFLKIEQGDKEALALFNKFKDITMVEVEKVYSRLGIKFDSYAGESFYNDKMQPILDELKQKGLLKVSDNAEIVELEGMPPCLLRKADGATLYATRDLAAAFYRKKTYDFYKCLYVVAYQQNLHFKQWFKVLDLMGYEWAKDLEHVAFGMVSLEDGAMSTRSGKVVYLVDVLDKAVDKSLEQIQAKNPSLADKERIAEQIGVGAVVFYALANNRIKDVQFSFDKVLNFDGETGPYVQYTRVRALSILKKASISGEADFTFLTTDAAMELVRHLTKWSDALSDAAKKYEPSIVTRYLVDLAQLFNKFYYETKIIDAPEGEKNARLMLTQCVVNVLTAGMGIIGISCPEAM